ncbi:hypothetical protein RMCBS344292_16339 [Rhizopus microsporus]|nr:hypothetical protein RMCBS344292_16339 [Rhizopus microsporus]
MPDYEPSPLIPIGDKKFLDIEYPGIVKRTKRAIKTLGGEKALAQSLANKTQVNLRFRPEDPFSHPIHGDIIPTSKLLAKVTRRVKRNKKTGQVEETDDDWRTEIVGSVTHSVRFRALADLQHIVPNTDRIRKLTQSLVTGNVQNIMDYEPAKDDDNIEDFRNIPPPVFTSRQAAFEYNYRQNLPVIRVKVKQPDGSTRKTLEVTFVRYDTENIPMKSWQIIKEPPNPQAKRAVDIVTELFKQKPIWNRYTIKCIVEPQYYHYLTTALAMNGYTFTNGPWRGAFVKYGIDPRKDQAYAVYQTLDFRSFHATEGKIPRYKGIRSAVNKPKAAQVEEVNLTGKQYFDGKSMPGPTSKYQLSEITDPDVTPLIYKRQYMRSEPNATTGFYYQCVYDRIRKALRDKHSHLINKHEPLPMPDLEKGLLEEIEKEKLKEDKNEELEVAEKAVAEAQTEAKKPNSSKRLKDMVDEYMEGLQKMNNSKPKYLGPDDDSDLDIMDTLEEYDEDFDIFNDDDENGGAEDENVQEDNMDIDKDVDDENITEVEE